MTAMTLSSRMHASMSPHDHNPPGWAASTSRVLVCRMSQGRPRQRPQQLRRAARVPVVPTSPQDRKRLIRHGVGHGIARTRPSTQPKRGAAPADGGVDEVAQAAIGPQQVVQREFRRHDADCGDRSDRIVQYDGGDLAGLHQTGRLGQDHHRVVGGQSKIMMGCDVARPRQLRGRCELDQRAQRHDGEQVAGRVHLDVVPAA